jgi:hypothetical protein
MNITLYSGVSLILLYLLAYGCYFVFRITSDKFYSPFHFMGGFLTFIFFNRLTHKVLLSLILVVMIGIIWEIYEWLMWKYVSKKFFARPKKKDTTSDLFFDLLGGVLALILTSLINF